MCILTSAAGTKQHEFRLLNEVGDGRCCTVEIGSEYYFAHRTSDGYTFVSERGRRYEIELWAKPTCTCPDHHFRGGYAGKTCKHIQAAKELRQLFPVRELTAASI